MGAFYRFDDDKIEKLSIAGDLHDIGKLAISNRLLDGFEKIVNWAANHHEGNDGSGYPLVSQGMYWILNQDY